MYKTAIGLYRFAHVNSCIAYVLYTITYQNNKTGAEYDLTDVTWLPSHYVVLISTLDSLCINTSFARQAVPLERLIFLREKNKPRNVTRVLILRNYQIIRQNKINKICFGNSAELNSLNYTVSKRIHIV